MAGSIPQSLGVVKVIDRVDRGANLDVDVSLVFEKQGFVVWDDMTVV